MLLCRPAKLTEGLPHPDRIMESALLAAVSPPDLTYEHHLQVTRCQDCLDNQQCSKARSVRAGISAAVFLSGIVYSLQDFFGAVEQAWVTACSNTC